MSSTVSTFSFPHKSETGLARIDADLRIRECTAAFTRLVGETVPGRLLSEVLPVFAGVEDFLRRMLRHGPHLWELRAVHHAAPGGEAARYLDVVIAPDEKEEGWLLSVRNVTAEVEEKRQMLQRYNEARLQTRTTPMASYLMQKLSPDILVALWEHLGLMLAVLNADLIIEAVTPPLAQSLQRSPVGLALAAILPELAGLEEELGRVARGEAEPWRLPGLHLEALAPSLWNVLFVARTDAPGLLLILRRAEAETMVEQELRQQRNELTLLHKKLEAQTLALRTANERLVQIDRERRALMELIIGDIKSALTVISGYGQWLARQPLAATAMHEEAVTAIQEAVNRINQLLDRMTTVERLEIRLGQLQRVPLDLRPLLEEVVVMRHEFARLLHIALPTQIPGHLPPIDGDAELLAEAFGRLLDYAIGRAVSSSHITVSSRVWKEWVLIEVAVGIPGRPGQSAIKASSSQQVFELTQVRLVIEGHGGHLTLEETKSGLHLTVWLPLADEAKGEPGITVAQERGEAIAPDAYEPLVVAEGALRIDRTRRQVWLHNVPLVLTPLEYRLLAYLAQHSGRVVGYEELLAVLSESEVPISLNHLRVLIARLRHKLGDQEETGGILRTMRGVGYVLIP
jgi:signal transduction histidine kinase